MSIKQKISSAANNNKINILQLLFVVVGVVLLLDTLSMYNYYGSGYSGWILGDFSINLLFQSILGIILISIPVFIFVGKAGWENFTNANPEWNSN